MTQAIPPIDLKRQYNTIAEQVDRAVLEVLHSGRYIGGPAISDFEAQFAQYIGTTQAVGCNSGTDALYLALRGYNIHSGDEVITTPFTFIATSEVIIRVGATPVFVDIDPETFNFNLQALEKAITPRTKAIIVVHIFGQPVNMTQLMDIAQRHNLIVIEDCAQATGSEWEGKKVGSIGDVGCFSFFPTKNLGTCGDGGAITTNNPEIVKKAIMLREHGSKARYLHEETGLNSRLDAIQAVILKIKLPYLDQWISQREIIAKNYDQLLANIPHIQLPQAIQGGKHSWNQYTILIDSTMNDQELLRDKVKNQLQEQGITCMIYYPLALHLQPVYRHLGYQKGSLPHTEKCTQEVLSLPMFPDLTPEEQERVARALKDCLS